MERLRFIQRNDGIEYYICIIFLQCAIESAFIYIYLMIVVLRR